MTNATKERYYRPMRNSQVYRSVVGNEAGEPCTKVYVIELEQLFEIREMGFLLSYHYLCHSQIHYSKLIHREYSSSEQL